MDKIIKWSEGAVWRLKLFIDEINFLSWFTLILFISVLVYINFLTVKVSTITRAKILISEKENDIDNEKSIYYFVLSILIGFYICVFGGLMSIDDIQIFIYPNINKIVYFLILILGVFIIYYLHQLSEFEYGWFYDALRLFFYIIVVFLVVFWLTTVLIVFCQWLFFDPNVGSLFKARYADVTFSFKIAICIKKISYPMKSPCIIS